MLYPVSPHIMILFEYLSPPHILHNCSKLKKVVNQNRTNCW